jgi:hypothetical protein
MDIQMWRRNDSGHSIASCAPAFGHALEQQTLRKLYTVSMRGPSRDSSEEFDCCRVKKTVIYACQHVRRLRTEARKPIESAQHGRKLTT